MHQLAKRPSAEQHYLGSAQWGLDRDGVRHGLCRKNRKLEVVAGEESSRPIESCINNGRIAEGREHAMWYETTRCPRAAGEATTTGGAARKGRPDPVRRRSPGPRLGEFRVPVVAGVSAARAKGITAQADAGATACVVGGPEAAAREAVVKGPASGRLHDRPVDAGAGGHPDSPRVRRSVSPESCVEGPDRPGVELSEARTPGRGAGRGGHCPLEA
jgi:hypothetical protein